MYALLESVFASAKAHTSVIEISTAVQTPHFKYINAAFLNEFTSNNGLFSLSFLLSFFVRVEALAGVTPFVINHLSVDAVLGAEHVQNVGDQQFNFRNFDGGVWQFVFIWFQHNFHSYY